jgi:hypothetical protein
MPQLPEGEEDTGLWQWNTGQTTRKIIVNTDWSYVYRVSYINSRGVESRLAFFISTTDEGEPVGIKGTKGEGARNGKEMGTAYDLQGRCVSMTSAPVPVPPKGVYIVNGRKVMR